MESVDSDQTDADLSLHWNRHFRRYDFSRFGSIIVPFVCMECDIANWLSCQ